MGSAIPIVELVSDGKYQLNEQILRSITSKAKDCQNIALISIIGSNIAENEFVLNCLTDYLQSQHKNIWPEKFHILKNVWFNQGQNRRPSVRIWSEPFILEVDEGKTAVFLMDSTHVFNKQLSNNKLTEDIIGLFCGTSSSLIYLKVGQFVKKELDLFKDTVETHLNRDFTTESFEELIYLIIDWDPNKPEFKDKNYLFGSVNGQKYMNQEFNINMDQCFAQTKCYLLPSIGVDVSDRPLSFAQINLDFINEFLQLIKIKLLNVDEMQIKMGADIKPCLKPDHLLTLFQNAIYQLNQINRDNFEELNIEENTNDASLQKRKDERERSFSSRSSMSIEVIDEVESYDLFTSDEEQEQTQQTNSVFNIMSDRKPNEDESIEMWSSVNCLGNHSDLHSNYQVNDNFGNYSSLTKSYETLASNDAPNNVNSIELSEEKFVKLTTNQILETDLDEINDILNNNNSDESQQSSVEDYFSELSYEATDQLNHKYEVLKRYKNLHLAQLKSFIGTSEFITREQLYEKHLDYSKENKVLFNEEIKSQNKETIENLNISLDQEHMSNFQELGQEVEQRRGEIVHSNLDTLKTLFCKLMDSILSSQVLITKIGLQKHFQNVEHQVFEALEHSVGQKDVLFKVYISNHLIECLESYRKDYQDKLLQQWTDSMTKFKHSNINEYQSKMGRIALEKRFNSVIEFHKLLKDSPTHILKKFDIEFNVSDGFTDNYQEIREQLIINLNEINEELHKDFTFREEFEKCFGQSVDEYDKTMMSSIECKLNNQVSNIFNFKLTEAELNAYHIKAKDSILDFMRNKHQISEDRKHKFADKFEHKFLDVLNQKRDNYRNIINSFHNYLNEWKEEFTQKEYFEDINDKNQIIIQRRKKLLDQMNQFVKDYSFKLFSKIYPLIIRENQLKKDVLKEKYELLFSKYIKNFENIMRHSIKSRLNHGNYDINLDGIYENKSKDTEKSFKQEVQTDSFLLNEFMSKLTKQMSTKKGKFQTALDQVTNYRYKWINQMNASRYLSEQTMREMNESMMRDIISSGDEELDHIVNKALNKIFEEFIQEMDKICEKEAIVAENVTQIAIKLFKIRFDNKLKSGLFTQIQVNAMFNQLLEHTIKVVLKWCDFNESQHNLAEECEKQLEVKLKEYLMKAFAQHSQNSVNAKHLLKQSVDSSLQLYKNQIQSIISENPIKRSEFQLKSDAIRKNALKHHQEQIEDILDYFNLDLYHKLLEDNQKEINTKINVKQMEFLNFVEKNAPKELSLGIYFGRFDLYSVCYEDGHENINDLSQDVKPNCVAIDQKIMVGSEARNYYHKKSLTQMYEQFDIKGLMRGSSLKLDEIYVSPFELTNQNKVKVTKDSIIYELSVESLIATQVMVIKAEAEQKTKAVVNSAVFTVPTHFNIKQRNAMKDVANIAGIDSVEILTEITAAALTYATDMSKWLPSDVLFIAMNGNKCDVALCHITNNQIKYESHIQQQWTVGEMINVKNARKKPKYFNLNDNYYDHVKKLFKFLAEDTTITINSLKNIVIIGSSDFIQDLRYYLKHSIKYDQTIIYDCDPIKVIVKGMAIYGNQSQRKNFDITEVSIYPIGYIVRGKENFSSPSMVLTNKNARLPTNQSYKMNDKTLTSNIPIYVDIFQDMGHGFKKMECFLINPLDEEMFRANYHIMQNLIHQVNIRVKDTGDVFIESVFLSKDTKTCIELKIVRLRFELTRAEIEDEMQILKLLLKKKPLENNEPFPTDVPIPRPAIDQELERSREELKAYYSLVKERLEKCEKLSSLLRETFEKQLSETWAVIESKESNRNKLIAHKGFLENIMNKTQRFIK